MGKPRRSISPAGQVVEPDFAQPGRESPSPSIPSKGHPPRTWLGCLARRLVTWYTAPLLAQQRRFEQAVATAFEEMDRVARAGKKQMEELEARLEAWRWPEPPGVGAEEHAAPGNTRSIYVGALAERLQRLSQRLNDCRTLQEPQPTSRVPVLGPLIVLACRLASRLSLRWYMVPILDQQRRFYEAMTAAFDGLADAAVSEARLAANLSARLDCLSQQPAVQEGQLAAAIRELAEVVQGPPQEQEAAASEAVGPGSLEDILSLSAEHMRAWEENDLPLGLDTRSESAAGEAREEDDDIMAPFSWRGQFYAWPYLFNLAVLAPRLNCRPGDLVLDFAGGSGWVSEFLNRMGIRTVLLDYAEASLRHSHARFAADRRLQEAAPVYPVRADGMSLPFADETFDGIICMNALHHMPSYEVVLQEMARVLKGGGRAVFGEPGELHARLSTAQWTMRQYGVFEKNVPLPLIYLYAKRSGFSKMWRYPYLYPTQAEFPYPEVGTTATVLRQLQDLLPEALVGYSLFTLEKAGQRPVTSCSPVGELQQHQLQAGIQLLSPAETVPAGSSFTDRIRVTNLGDVVWVAAANPWGGHVTLGVKLCDESGRETGGILSHQFLPQDLAPGEETEMEVSLTAPASPGRYILKYDMVNIGRLWFELWGSKPVERALVVTS